MRVFHRVHSTRGRSVLSSFFCTLFEKFSAQFILDAFLNLPRRRKGVWPSHEEELCAVRATQPIWCSLKNS